MALVAAEASSKKTKVELALESLQEAVKDEVSCVKPWGILLVLVQSEMVTDQRK